MDDIKFLLKQNLPLSPTISQESHLSLTDRASAGAHEARDLERP